MVVLMGVITGVFGGVLRDTISNRDHATVICGENPMTWTDEFPAAITVCDRNGIIIDMNEKSARSFEADGGRALVGRSLLNCHPEPSRSQVADMLARPRVNAYTIEKRGVRKLIYQAPWFRDGVAQGLVELSLEIPADMPHFVRQS